MKHITSLFQKTINLYGNTDGILEIRKLTLYEEDDEPIPSGDNCYPALNCPCLVVEEIDREISNSEIKALTPVALIKLTPEQVDFFKKYKFNNELGDVILIDTKE